MGYYIFFKSRSIEELANAVSAVPDLAKTGAAVSRIWSFKTNKQGSRTKIGRMCQNRYSGSYHSRKIGADKKKYLSVRKPKNEESAKIAAIADAKSFTAFTHIEGTTRHEVRMVELAFGSRYAPHDPDRIIGDRV